MLETKVIILFVNINWLTKNFCENKPIDKKSDLAYKLNENETLK